MRKRGMDAGFGFQVSGFAKVSISFGLVRIA
jgi:hypothetical protein